MSEMSTLYDLFAGLISFLWRLAQSAWEAIEEKLWLALAGVALAVARLFGTVVETGWRGVLFRCGRVHTELSPGFRFLIPLVHTVRKVQIRSVSFKLPRQRIATRDGLAYDVAANVVYHVKAPTVASVQVDDVDRGCRVVVPLVIAELIREQTRETVGDRSRLDAELSRRLQARFDRWGLAVERAGFQSIAPTRETLRITQLSPRCHERYRVYRTLLAEGKSPKHALPLLGASTRLMERSAAHYRGYRRPNAARPRLARRRTQAEGFQVGDRVMADWLELGEYHPGVVTKRTGMLVDIKYDSGDEETKHVRNVRSEEPSDEA